MNGHQKQREQSGRRIEEALFELMREKSYSQITISELVKRADVARRTFYRLYKEKDEVLRCYLDRLCQEYCRRAPVLNNYNISQIAEEFFGFWYQHRDFLLLMRRCDLEEMLYYEISRASLTVIKKRMESAEQNCVSGIEYFADYSTGGFCLLLSRWVAAGMQETPEQYAKTVSEALQQFIRPVSLSKQSAPDSLK